MELDIPDTSSDSSNDQTILCTGNENNYDDDVSCPSSTTDSELDSLLKKYLNEDLCHKFISKAQPVKEISESNNEFSNCDLPKISKCESSKKMDDCAKTSLLGSDNQESHYELDSFSDLPSFSQFKRLKTRDSHVEVNPVIHLSSSSEEIEIAPEYLNKNGTNKEKKKIAKENMQKQRELKKEEERKNKALKNALSSHFKNLKPENCLKFIKAHIDSEISSKNFSEDIVNELQNNGVSFTVETQLAKSSISWTRQIDSHILDTDGKLIDTSKGLKIDEVVIILECIDFLNHLHNQTFTTYIENLCTTLMGKKIILIVYGLERYFRFQKNKKNHNFASEISGKTHKVTDQRLFENVPTVSRRTVEYALTEIQLLYSISHRLIETKKELALFVFQITKSIAQLPHKLQKQEKFIQSKWFMSESNKNCIMVDKNGNGLSRLWKQIMTTFPMTTLETAEAICSVYPTPFSLYKAYDNIKNSVEGERLLQDVPIRRTAGPIGTMRKIGPELSKKFYYLFTSLDPEKIL